MGMLGAAAGWKIGSKYAGKIGQTVGGSVTDLMKNQHIGTAANIIHPSAGAFLQGNADKIGQAASAAATIAAPYVISSKMSKAQDRADHAVGRAANFIAGASQTQSTDTGMY